MTDRLIYGGIAIVLLVLAGWGYGNARYAEGRADTAAEQAALAAAQMRSAAELQSKSRATIQALQAELKTKKEQFDAKLVEAKRRDATYAAWLSQRVHPVSVTTYDGLRRDTTNSSGAAR